MKLDRRILLAALLALASLSPLSPSSRVATAQASTEEMSDATASADLERWWGVVATITCGITIKMVTVTGPQPAIVSLALGSCSLALLDVITTEE